MFDARRGNSDFEPEVRPGTPPRPRGSLLPVLIVLGFGLAVIVSLVGLTGLAGLYIMLAIGGVLGFAAMHYVLWGWWLTNKIRQDGESEADE